MLKTTLLRLLVLPLLAAGTGCAGTLGNRYPLEAGYLLHSEIFSRLKALAETEPEITRLNIIGFSGTENLPIYALAIGQSSAQRNVLMIGQHHGDEVLGVELVLAWAGELAGKSHTDKRIGRILRDYRFWIVPTLNPEAYRVVTSGQFQYKRKNNRDTTGNGRLDLRTDGVDLNRNYPVFWDEDLAFPPTHQNYKGSAPASEPEVQAVLALAQKQDFDLAIFYHSSASGAYSEKIFLPALDNSKTRQQARYESTLAFAQSYAGLLKKDYGKGNYQVGTQPGSRVGNARNYFFHIRETAAFLVEIGGINRNGISVIHPPFKQREKIVARHLKALRKVFYDSLTEATFGVQADTEDL